MKFSLHSFFLTLFLFFSSASVFAAVDFREVEQRRQHNRFIGLRANSGAMLVTHDFIRTLESRYYQSLSLRFGFRSTGSSWQDFAFGMPYTGLGLYVANFPTTRELFGNPIAVYMFHGGTIRDFNPRFSLHYEWNLGASFNWLHYDSLDNPENTIISSPTNVYISVNAYARWQLSPRIDLNLGAGLGHFSNGAIRLPNKGMNLFSTFVELTYALDGGRQETVPIPPPTAFEPRIDYDFTLTVSSRQVRVDTVGTGLTSRHLNYNFPVIGLSFAPLFVPNHRYKYGLSLDLLYDRGSNVRAWREQNYDRMQLAPARERFSAGLSVQGEITMPLYSIFANIGYNFIHHTTDPRLYQIIGVKIYPHESLFVTFGIRAHYFSRAQFLYWSLGYTLGGGTVRRRR